VTDVPALTLEHVRKRFGNVAALVDASLVVRPGSVHALLGENGAGKTTLMRIAFGMHSPDAGTVRVRGNAARLGSPGEAIRLGIAMVHQHFTLVPAMTVAENLALGGRGRFNATGTGHRIKAIADATGLSVDPEARVADLSIAAQQRLELLKALSQDAQILIFDEPTAVLAPSESADLLRRIRELADSGHAVVLITHKLREALSIADDITVLRRGSTVLSKHRNDVDEQSLIEAMLGQREMRPTRPREPAAPRATVISARDIFITDARRARRIRGATFDVRGGEIVGIAAVEGSGHQELLRAVARRMAISSGLLELPDAVGFVPDDRHRDGLVLGMSIIENYALRDSGSRRGRVRWTSIAAGARRVVDEYDVRIADLDAKAESLSGGNQQKFIVGRELQGRPSALVVENPTRGLDIRATAFVHDQLIQARADGVAIMLYSADLDEVIELSDRVLVVYGGIVREVPGTRDVIGRAMLGVDE
jgi:general nucleoside transport system ATP-binding protein